MKISFDLDGVLFIDPQTIPAEPPLPGPLARLYPERLRKGTIRLIHDLQSRGFEVWVYTSSYRRERYLLSLFWLYGIKFDQIINGYRHDRDIQEKSRVQLPSKLPNYYQISLHIDDDIIVARNARTYSFHVLLVDRADPDWTEKVLREAERIREMEILS